MRQMACHPDLVLRSKNNQGKFLIEDDGESMVCRLCNDVVEDAIKAKCNHVFDRECIKQYLNTAIEQTVCATLFSCCLPILMAHSLRARSAISHLRLTWRHQL
jgi:DNA repair protein RAD16